jgi:hypothetical protein
MVGFSTLFTIFSPPSALSFSHTDHRWQDRWDLVLQNRCILLKIEDNHVCLFIYIKFLLKMDIF